MNIIKLNVIGELSSSAKGGSSSGGEGGNSDDSSSIEYYRVDENLISALSGDNASVLTMFPNLVFIKNSSLGIMVTSFAVLITFFPVNNMTEILAQSQGIAFFMDASIKIGDTIATLRDLIGAETTSKWQKITKDEFYNLGV